MSSYIVKKLIIAVLLISGSSIAADISYQGSNINIIGEIVSGDASKFEELLLSVPKSDEFIAVSLASGGGDVVEAVKIGRLMRESFIPAFESTMADRGKCFTLSSPTQFLGAESCGCHSACFVIWAGAPFRIGSAPTVGEQDGIGIHRPRFNQDYFKGLSVAEAEAEYEGLTNFVKQYLSEMGIPNQLTEKMFSVSSKNIYQLSEGEIDQLKAPPAIAEWFISKCGIISDKDKRSHRAYWSKFIQGYLENEDDGYMYFSDIEKRHFEQLSKQKDDYKQCETDAIIAEQATRPLARRWRIPS